jgi:hypothetical protein
MKKTALLGALLLTLGGCSYFGGGSSDDMAASSGDAKAASTAIKDAEAAIDKSATVDGEWRDAKKKILKKAKAAASKGDYDKAVKLAEFAKFQGEMGYQQAMEQKNAKPWLF